MLPSTCVNHCVGNIKVVASWLSVFFPFKTDQPVPASNWLIRLFEQSHGSSVTVGLFQILPALQTKLKCPYNRCSNWFFGFHIGMGLGSEPGTSNFILGWGSPTIYQVECNKCMRKLWYHDGTTIPLNRFASKCFFSPNIWFARHQNCLLDDPLLCGSKFALLGSLQFSAKLFRLGRKYLPAPQATNHLETMAKVVL